jgi:hypothetical protein
MTFVGRENPRGTHAAQAVAEAPLERRERAGYFAPGG